MHTPGTDRDARSRGVNAVAGRGSAGELDAAARKEQQLVFLLTRQLVDAQCVRADRERSQRLWQEVAALELDPDRITALMYGVCDHDDRLEMEAVDRAQREIGSHPPFWISWRRRTPPTTRQRGGGLRNARPATLRAHRQAR